MEEVEETIGSAIANAFKRNQTTADCEQV